MADIPVTIDGKVIGNATLLGREVVGIIITDDNVVKKLNQGTITGISISDRGIGNIELV